MYTSVSTNSVVQQHRNERFSFIFIGIILNWMGCITPRPSKARVEVPSYTIFVCHFFYCNGTIRKTIHDMEQDQPFDLVPIASTFQYTSTKSSKSNSAIAANDFQYLPQKLFLPLPPLINRYFSLRNSLFFMKQQNPLSSRIL